MEAITVPESVAIPDSIDIAPEPPFIIVDASNVALSLAARGGMGSCRALCSVIDQVSRLGLAQSVIADASLRYRVDDNAAYEAMVSQRVVLQAPAGRSADQFIRLLAEKRKARGQQVFILSNDRLRQFPELSVPRITYLAISAEEVLFDPPLEVIAQAKAGPRQATSFLAEDSALGALRVGRVR